MRAWTLVVSIVVHVLVIAGVVVAPLFATGERPMPPRATEYVRVTAHVPDPPPAPRAAERAPARAAAPVTVPNDVPPETPRPPPPPSPGPTDFDAPGGDPYGGPFLHGVVPDADPVPPPPQPAAPRTPVRPGGAIRPPQRIAYVEPRYPAIARAAREEGVVILEAVIDEEGAVRDVHVLRSKPLLDDAAVEAVRQWRFTPTLLNGQPVPVVMTVTVSFGLAR